MSAAIAMPQPGLQRPRYLTFGVVVLIHAALVGAFATMRVSRPLFHSAEALQVSLYDAPARASDPVPALKPVMIETHLQVPNPEVQIAVTPEPAPVTVAAPEHHPSAVVALDGSSQNALRAITPADYLKAPATLYPPLARKQRQQGLVVLRVSIGADGRPVDVQVERSSGFALLDHAARDAVRDALFKPFIENGVARSVQVLVPIEFSMPPRAGR